jgi:hypothetical protein
MLLMFGQEIKKYACGVTHSEMLIVRIVINIRQLVQILFRGGYRCMVGARGSVAGSAII